MANVGGTSQERGVHIGGRVLHTDLAGREEGATQKGPPESLFHF